MPVHVFCGKAEITQRPGQAIAGMFTDQHIGGCAVTVEEFGRMQLIRTQKAFHVGPIGFSQSSQIDADLSKAPGANGLCHDAVAHSSLGPIGVNNRHGGQI
jgi:hypothetical protein